MSPDPSLPAVERTLRHDLWGILRAALAAVDPARLVSRWLQQHPGAVPAQGALPVLAVGKGALAMAAGAVEALGPDRLHGLVVAPEASCSPADSPILRGDPAQNLEILAATHPLPDAGSVAAGAAVSKLAEGLAADEHLLVLISGGASSLLALPAHGLALDDLRATYGSLLGSGASIDQLNAVRKHLEQLKGGQLARLTAPAKVLALVLSDVVGDHLETIASGPLVGDPSTYGQALEIVSRLAPKAPSTVWQHLQRGVDGELMETPLPGDSCFEAVRTEIIGNGELAARAAAAEAERRGYRAQLLGTEVEGEARRVGIRLARHAAQMAKGQRVASGARALIQAGETTVEVRGRGRGGRNQELALAAVSELAGLPGLALASLGTDGVDGPTEAAGALASGSTMARAGALGMEPQAFLEDNDSHTFFAALQDLLHTGPTHTNVGDLQVVLAAGTEAPGS